MADEKKQRRRRFSEEFKRDAAALVIDTGRPVAHVARELGVYESSLTRWRRRSAPTAASPTT